MKSGIHLLLLSLCVFCIDAVSAPAQQRQNYDVAITADDFVAKQLFGAISEEFGLQFTYRHFDTFGEVLDSIRSGESDFAPNTTYSEQRAKYLHLPAPTNIEYTYLFYKDNIDFKHVKRVAVPIRTIFVDLVKRHYPSIAIYEYSTVEEAQKLLDGGQVDAIVAGINYLKAFNSAGFQAEVINNKIGAPPVTIAVAKDSDVTLVEQFVRYAQTEPVQRLLHDSMIHYQKQIRLTAIKKNLVRHGLDQAKPLSIKLEPVYPYVIYQTSGAIKGVTYTILQQTCQMLELNCKVTSRADESWQSMYTDFKAQNIDVIAPIHVSQSRESYTYFAKPHYRAMTILVKRSGYKDGIYRYVSELITERIGVVKEDYAVKKLQAALPQKQFYFVDNQQALIDALVAGEVDYIVVDRAALNRMLRKDKLLNIEEDDSLGVFFESNIAFGFNRTEEGRLLAEAFSQVQDIIDIQSIANMYNIQPAWRNLYSAEQKFNIQVRVLFVMFVLFATCALLYLNHQSTTDQLTGLKNRRALDRYLAKSTVENGTVLYLDINRFKQFNDTYGHHFGDEVLRAVAKQIKRLTKENAYRVGGDEFIVISRLGSSGVERLKSQLSTVCVKRSNGEEVEVTVAIGIARDIKSHSGLRQLLKKADTAMYSDKSSYYQTD